MLPKNLLGNMCGCDVLGLGSGKCNGVFFLQTQGNGSTCHSNNIAANGFAVGCVRGPVGVTKNVEVGIQDVVVTSIGKLVGMSVLEIPKNSFDGGPVDLLWILCELRK